MRREQFCRSLNLFFSFLSKKVSTCYQIYNTSTGLAWIDQHKGQYSWLDSFYASYIASLVFLIIALAMDIMLCVIAGMHNPKYKVGALIWVIWTSICCVILLVIAIVLAVLVNSFAVVVVIVIVYGVIIVLSIYYCLVVFSYYQELRDGPTSPAVVMVQQPGYIVQQPGGYGQPGYVVQQPGGYGQSTMTVTTEAPPQYKEKDNM